MDHYKEQVMSRRKFAITVAVAKKKILILPLLLIFPLVGQPVQDIKPPQESLARNKSYYKVVLTRRANNGPYETSAYSFRHETQDVKLHRNNVDVVFNGCGQLHINPHGGLQGVIADVGEGELEKLTLEKVKQVPKQAWRRFCLLPEDGHLYIHKGRFLNQEFTVAFKIKQIAPDKLGMQWRFLEQQERGEQKYRYVGAGTMGQCGGAHAQR